MYFYDVTSYGTFYYVEGELNNNEKVAKSGVLAVSIANNAIWKCLELIYGSSLKNAGILFTTDKFISRD